MDPFQGLRLERDLARSPAVSQRRPRLDLCVPTPRTLNSGGSAARIITVSIYAVPTRPIEMF